MPRIELIPEVYYNPLDPYHHEYDNLPLKNIIERQVLINTTLDKHDEQLREAAGTQGSLSNRLNQFVDEDGELLSTAIDDVTHSIGAHTDGVYDSVEYVRMLKSERDKLALIADEAKDLTIQVEEISTTTTFDSGILKLINSDTNTLEIVSTNEVKINSVFPEAAAHQHYYDMVPVHANISTPDYQNYKSTSLSTPYVDGSLRVFINGIKLTETDSVYVPGPLGPDDNWYLTTFTSDYSNGTFALNRAIDPDDVILIDFDISYV